MSTAITRGSPMWIQLYFLTTELTSSSLPGPGCDERTRRSFCTSAIRDVIKKRNQFTINIKRCHANLQRNTRKVTLVDFCSTIIRREDHHLPLVGVQHFSASLYVLVCIRVRWVSTKNIFFKKDQKLLTFPASLSGLPESLSEDFPLVRLSKEWQEVASNRAS